MRHITQRPSLMTFLITGLLVAVTIAALTVWLLRDTTDVIALDDLDPSTLLGMVMERAAEETGLDVCGEEVTADVAAESLHHGLDSNSEMPPEIAAEVAFAIEQYGGELEDHEQRHFDTHRALLISWDATSKDLGEGFGPELGSVYEVHFLTDDDGEGWNVVFAGTAYECPAD
jgi:hypothetical protein